MRPDRAHRLGWFLGITAGVFAVAIWGVAGLPWRARIFPQTVAGMGLMLTILAWITAARIGRKKEEVTRPEHAEAASRLALRRSAAWGIAYLAAIALLGFPAASGLWVTAFLRWEDRSPWRWAAVAGAATTVALVALASITRMPAGVLGG